MNVWAVEIGFQVAWRHVQFIYLWRGRRGYKREGEEISRVMTVEDCSSVSIFIIGKCILLDLEWPHDCICSCLHCKVLKRFFATKMVKTRLLFSTGRYSFRAEIFLCGNPCCSLLPLASNVCNCRPYRPRWIYEGEGIAVSSTSSCLWGRCEP